jgi:hypothetical protein
VPNRHSSAPRPQTVATAEELACVWRGLHRENVFPIHPLMVIAFDLECSLRRLADGDWIAN